MIFGILGTIFFESFVARLSIKITKAPCDQHQVVDFCHPLLTPLSFYSIVAACLCNMYKVCMCVCLNESQHIFMLHHNAWQGNKKSSFENCFSANDKAHRNVFSHLNLMLSYISNNNTRILNGELWEIANHRGMTKYRNILTF